MLKENERLQALMHVDDKKSLSKPLDVLEYFLRECKRRFGRAPHIHDREKPSICVEIERFRATRDPAWNWSTYQQFIDACLASYAPPNFAPQLRHITSPKMLNFIENKQATETRAPAARTTLVTRADRINWAAVRQQGARSELTAAH